MLNEENLRKKLDRIDKKGYGAYQSLVGKYNFPYFTLVIDKVPKDPYAPPRSGIFRIQVQRSHPKIIDANIDSKIKEIAFRDFIARCFYQSIKKIKPKRRGTGHSGMISISFPGQLILERTSVIINKDIIEIRFYIALPAFGRRVNANGAREMLLQELPEIVFDSLFENNIDTQALIQHIQTAEDAEFLRTELESRNLVAFIADQSILPRKSGISDYPLDRRQAIPFLSPESLKLKIKLPNAGTISGMGIPKGVTLIVGGGFHGKSTLLNTIESAIYNHVPADGREQCASIAETVKIRSYSGRSIVKTNISPFIQNLPLEKDTSAFSTENASGSTSQAASIVEAIEAGAKVLLMDEDTCATNFMIRDKKMQELVHKKDEPITPFIDKVQQLYQERGVSTILVLGGAGDYFEVADNVIQMLKFKPLDVTKKAQQIIGHLPKKRASENTNGSFNITERIPLAKSINPYRGKKKRVKISGKYSIQFGNDTIDLTDVEQLIEQPQTRAVALAIEYARRYMNEQMGIKDLINQVEYDISQNGLDILGPRISGDLARFSILELAFALNQIRSLQVIQKRQISS